MPEPDEVQQALDACYDAALEPELWPAALERLAQSLGAIGCCFYPQDAGERRRSVPASPHYRDFLDDFLRGGWWRHDHRAARGWPLLTIRGRAAVVEHDIVSDDERRSLPVYDELYRRYDAPWWAAVGFQVDGHSWAVPFLRSSRQGPFLPDDAARLANLSQHCSRLVHLAGKLATDRATASLSLLERLACPAILLDWRGAVREVNRAAAPLFDAGLSLRHGRPHARDRRSDEALQQLIRWATGSAPHEPAEPGPVLVARPEERPLLVEAIPAGAVLKDSFLHACAILVVRDLEAAPTVSAARLQRALGLTAAEARLAAGLAAGGSLDSIAAEVGVATATVRTQLKAVFEKAGVHRQAELVALVAQVGPDPR